MVGRLPIEIQNMVFLYVLDESCLEAKLCVGCEYDDIETLDDDGCVLQVENLDHLWRVLILKKSTTWPEGDDEFGVIFESGLALASKAVARCYLSAVLPHILLCCRFDSDLNHLNRTLEIIFGIVIDCPLRMNVQVYLFHAAFTGIRATWSGKQIESAQLEWQVRKDLEQLAQLPRDTQFLIYIFEPCKDLSIHRRLVEELGLLGRPRFWFIDEGCSEVHWWCYLLTMAAMSGRRLSVDMNAEHVRILAEDGCVGMEDFVEDTGSMPVQEKQAVEEVGANDILKPKN